MSETHGTHSRASFRLREPRLADLDSAIEWLREKWDGQRTAPKTLNVDDTEGELGGLRYSGAFAAVLAWQPRESRRMQSTRICAHPMTHGRGDECPECQGTGVKDVQTFRYPYPMSTALVELSHVVTKRGQVPALEIIFAVAYSAFRPRVAMQLLGISEDAVLGAIRQLFHHYQEGPTASVSVAWTEMSDSQRNAVVAGENAA